MLRELRADAESWLVTPVTESRVFEPLEIIIHKGSQEIGGNCIQISSGTTTILLDAGLPLRSDSKPVDVSGLITDALLISHSHRDHFGQMGMLKPGTPVYIGKLARKLIDAPELFLGGEIHSLNFQHFEAWRPFPIGDFTITPYLVDHSATDAYAFLIEAEGKRLFYGGDFRSHGRKGKLFEQFVQNPIRDIDLMFLEGTMLHRSNDLFPNEASVEGAIFETIRGQKNISFLLASSQNIDRIVSAYRACKRAGKILVIDVYTAWVLEQLRTVTQNTPAMDWPEVRVFAEYRKDQKLKANPEYFGDFRKRLYRYRVKREELHANPQAFLYFGRCRASGLSTSSRAWRLASALSTRNGSGTWMELTPIPTGARRSPAFEAIRRFTSFLHIPADMLPLRTSRGL